MCQFKDISIDLLNLLIQSINLKDFYNKFIFKLIIKILKLRTLNNLNKI